MARTRGRRSSALLLSPLVFVAACASFQETARNKFVHEATCPYERVAMRERQGPLDPPPLPPPDIAADPGRLAVWRADEEHRRAAEEDATHYVADGCGQERTYDCYRPTRNLCCPVCTERTDKRLPDPATAKVPPPSDTERATCLFAPPKPPEPMTTRNGGGPCTLGNDVACEASCNEGDAESCTLAAKAYEEGIGLPVDFDKGLAFAKKACDGGSARGCNALGIIFDLAHGVPADPGAAMSQYTRACTMGYAEACANMGAHYVSGRGVPASNVEAARYSRTACAWGSAAGCNRLGALLRAGFGETNDAACSLVAFRNACVLGDARACDAARLLTK